MINQNVRTQKGVFLLEALVALMVFSFGILGLVGLQAISSQNSVDAENRTTASLLANDVTSQMWVNRVSGITFAGLQSADVTAWQTRVADSKNLPNAVGTIAMAGTVATISITWKAPSKKLIENTSRFQTQVDIQ